MSGDPSGRWRRYCPLGDWTDPTLDAIGACLDDPATMEGLRADDAARRYPRQAMDALRKAGLTALFTEERLTTAYHQCALNAMAARVNGSLAISIGVNFLALLPLHIAGSRVQRSRAFARFREGEVAGLLLSEWSCGSDLGRIRTRAEKTPDGFRINGEKHLINGGREAKMLVTLARTGDPPAGGGPLAVAPLSLFYLERDGSVEVTGTYRTLPAPAADISAVRFRDTPASEEALLGNPGEGFSILQRTLSVSRGGIGSLAAGASARAWDLASGYARERRIYGGPLYALGAIVDHLMRLAARDALTAALAVKAAAAMNALGPAASYLTSVAKVACCDLAEEAVDEGRRVLGARALVHELPYAQLARDVLLYGVFDGTRHVVLASIEQALARMAARTARDGDGDTIAVLRQIYEEEPQPLSGVVGRRSRPWLPSLARHPRALADLPGALDLEPLADLAAGMVELAREFQPGRRWASDQGARFELAGAAARLEAVIALAELGDPVRREALGAKPMPMPGGEDPDLLRFALGWGGARAGADLRQLYGRAGVEVPASLLEAEGVSLRLMEAARTDLRRRLPNPEGGGRP